MTQAEIEAASPRSISPAITLSTPYLDLHLRETCQIEAIRYTSCFWQGFLLLDLTFWEVQILQCIEGIKVCGLKDIGLSVERCLWTVIKDIQGGFFNWSARFSVPKWKTSCSQPGLVFHEIFNVKKLLVGWASFFILVLKIGQTS